MTRRKRNNIIIGSLLAFVCLMAVGYSAFLTKLDIKGTTNISSEWNIKIISASVLNTNGTAESVKSTYTDLTANLEANLYNKGDFVEYKILVENSGDFDAKLDTLGITNSNNEAVKITASGFTKGQTLYKKTTKELIVKIAYNSNYEGDAGGTSGESNITLGFVQNEGGTITPTKDHLVTYDYVTNGGESTTAENEYLAEGSNINLSYTASKKNYEFLGWSQSASSKTPLTSLTMGTEDITLFAIFKIIDTTPPVIENTSYTSTTNSITVAVTASDPETEITKYEYSINDGDYVTDSKTHTFTGLTQDTSYKIKVRVTNEAGLQSEEELGSGKTISDLKTELVTTGDGLYKDSALDGRYFYRGSTPNNYITFNGEMWRIISIESDGSLKIVRSQQLSSTQVWDAAGNRSSSTSTYCTNASSYGCNVWSSTSNLVNKPSTITYYYPNGNTSDSTNYTGTVTSDSTMATYLNGTYYNSLSTAAKAKVVKGTFNVSTPGNYNDTESLETDATQEKQYQWKGNVALYTVTELLRASTNSSCTSSNKGNSSGNCNTNNWLWPTFNYTSYEWTLSPFVNSDRYYVWFVYSSGSVNLSFASSSHGVRPVLNLTSNISLGGKGTSDDPYTIAETPKTKALEKPTYSGDSNTITITYPSGCGNGITCSYIKDGGEEVKVTSNTVDVEFTNNGTLVAKVNDGNNSISSSYTFKLTAKMLVYDNSTSGIDCGNVQCAIDEIKKQLS